MGIMEHIMETTIHGVGFRKMLQGYRGGYTVCRECIDFLSGYVSALRW